MARFNPRFRRNLQDTNNTDESDKADRKVRARLRAVRVSATTAMFLAPMWFIIMISWGLSIAGIAAASVTFFGYQLIGDGLAVAFILIGWLWQLLTLMIAFVVYWISKVDCTSTWPMIVFSLLIAVSLVPVIQIIPWVFVYMFAVVVLQTGEKTS